MLQFLMFMCVIGSLQATPVKEIFVSEDENQVISIQSLSGKRVHIFPTDKKPYKFLSIKNDLNLSGEHCIVLSSSEIGERTFTRRVTNSAIQERDVKSDKYRPFKAEWKNFALSGEDDTCHVITDSIDLKEILVLNSPETTTYKLSMNFQNSFLRLKFLPLQEGAPYWIQGKVVPETIQIDTSEKKGDDDRQPAVMTDFSVLKFGSDLQVVNASVEVIFASSF